MAKNRFKKKFSELGTKRKDKLEAKAEGTGLTAKQLYRQKGQRKEALRTFDKGSESRGFLKDALSDGNLSKKEVRGLIASGADKKQLSRLRRISGQGKGIKSKFFKKGAGSKGQLGDFYGKVQDRLDIKQIDDQLTGDEEDLTQGGSDLEDFFSGQLNTLISGQETFRSDMMDMFSNMMAMGQSRPGVLGVRSARRGQDGQTGMTSQFGREGLRIRSLNI
jgi:hypothetical protein